jgi:predicted RNA-binding protein with PIN domain
MSYLIDGYNLLYALGVLGGRTGPAGLEQARRRLLGLLLGSHRDEPSAVTVVFDASHAPPGATGIEEYHGINVRFAVKQAEADDLIEDLIRQHSAPRQLTVVSNDHRIQQAARRRHCVVLDCAAYLDLLERRRRARPADGSTDSEKPEGVSGEETQRWLREFADLTDDPGMKELFEPF